MKFQIYQLQANLNVDDGGSKRIKYNRNNSDLQGIKRTVRMEDKDEEWESSAKAQLTVKISDVHLSALAVHLGDVNLEVATVVSLTENTSELDTHSDTCVVGRHAFVIERHHRVVNVSGYNPSKGSVKNLEIVNAAITVNDVDTGESHVVIINQEVQIPTMEHKFLCPIQMQMHGVIVNDTPKFLLGNPTDNDHCLLLQNKTLDEKLRIPLIIKGVSSVLQSFKSTR